TELARDVARHHLRRVEPARIDVVQRDLRVAQRRQREDVREQVLREDDAARADEGDPRHPLFAPSASPPMKYRCSARNSAIVGSATITAAAEMRLRSVKNVPWRFVSDDVMGRLSPELIKTTAQRKSL